MSGPKRVVPLEVAIIGAMAIAGVAGVMGFFIGVASTKAGSEFLTDMVEHERAAEVGQAQTLDRAGFSLSYPGNWRIDTADEDYDPDASFTIDSPGSSFVMLSFAPSERDLAFCVQAQTEAFTKLMGTPQVTPFTRYGAIEGNGTMLRGRILGSRSTVRAFCYNRDGKSGLVVEQHPDEDARLVSPGLALIEKSLLPKP